MFVSHDTLQTLPIKLFHVFCFCYRNKDASEKKAQPKVYCKQQKIAGPLYDVSTSTQANNLTQDLVNSRHFQQP